MKTGPERSGCGSKLADLPGTATTYEFACAALPALFSFSVQAEVAGRAFGFQQ